MNTDNTGEAQDVVVASIEKNYNEKIDITVGSYKGTPIAQVRTWFRSREDGSWRPSKAGIAIRPALLPRLAEGIQQAIEQARRAGSL